MSGHKRRHSVRFPPSRIKKIMQKDTEVGRIAKAVPVIISRALEMFLKALLTKTCLITQSKLSTVVSLAHMRQCVESERMFHFLKDLLERTSATQQKDSKNMSIWPLYRTSHHEITVKKSVDVKEKTPRQSLDSFHNDSSSSESELYICL